MKTHDQLTAVFGLVNSLHWLWSKQASISATLCSHTNVTVQQYQWTHYCCCRPTNLPPAQREVDPGQPRFVTRGHVCIIHPVWQSIADSHGGCALPHMHTSCHVCLLYKPWCDCTHREPHVRSPGASTPCKPWSKCSMKNLGGSYFYPNLGGSLFQYHVFNWWTDLQCNTLEDKSSLNQFMARWWRVRWPLKTTRSLAGPTH